jgi:diguanylate cyclase (GGDEF)-like protein
VGADRMLLASLALAASIILGCTLDLGGLSTQAIVCWLAIAAFQTAMAVFAAQVARALDSSNPARRFWLGYAFAGFVYAIGDIGQVLITVFDPLAPASLHGGDLRTACLGIGTAGVLVVMLGFPLGLTSKRERVRLWLDLATVMVGAAAFGAFWAGPDGFTGGVTLGDLVAVFAGPVPVMVAVFAVAKLLLTGRPPFTWQTGVLGASAAAIEGLSRGLGPMLVDNGQARWFFATTVASHVLLMASARVQHRQVVADPGILREGRRRPYSPLPYVAIAGTYVFLAASLVRDASEFRTWLVFTAAAVCTALVVARQLTALADNARLLTELDIKVRELRRAEGVLRTAVDEREELTGEVRELAFADSLTGLANRTLFTVRLEEAWVRARGYGGKLGVMLIDIDDFKPVNDRMGHDAGDLLLKQAGARLVATLRESDMVARLGGDEFAVLLSRPTLDNLHHVAQRVLASLAEPYAIWGEQVRVTASIGIAVERGERTDVEHLMRDADEAIYKAKSRGKGTAEIFA